MTLELREHLAEMEWMGLAEEWGLVE